jgi:hypothetical protein
MAVENEIGALQKMQARANAAGDTEAVTTFGGEIQRLMDTTIEPATMWEKFGGGAQRAVTGVQQIFGAKTGAQAREEQKMLDRADPKGIISAIGSGAMLAPAALVGGASIPGMALGGALGSMLMPTEEDDILAGKLKQGAAGAVLGPVVGKALPLAMGGARAAGRGIANQVAERTPFLPGRRADIAAREFAESFGDDATRAQAATDLAGRAGRGTQLPTPTGRAVVPQTTAEVLTGTEAGQALGRQEALTRRLGGEIAEPLEEVTRGRTRAINEAVETTFNPTRREAASEAMADYGATQSRALRDLTPGFQYDPNTLGRMVPAFQQAKQGVTGPVRDAVNALEKDFFEAMLEANKTGSSEALHNFRRTGINDRLSTMFGPGASQTQTLARTRLRDVREALTSDIDDIIANNPTGRGFRDYMEGYAARAQRVGKMERGEGALAALNRGAADPQGLHETGQLASNVRRAFSRGEEPVVQAGRGRGDDMFTPGGRSVLRRTRNVLDAASGVRANTPPGSATAANTLASKTGVLGRARAAQEATQSFSRGEQGVGIAGAAFGSPTLALSSLAKHFVLDPIRATALSDIARQVVGAMSNPAQAQAALARYAQQQGLRQNEVAFLQALTQQTARLAAPAGAAAGAMMPATQEGVR